MVFFFKVKRFHCNYNQSNSAFDRFHLSTLFNMNERFVCMGIVALYYRHPYDITRALPLTRGSSQRCWMTVPGYNSLKSCLYPYEKSIHIRPFKIIFTFYLLSLVPFARFIAMFKLRKIYWSRTVLDLKKQRKKERNKDTRWNLKRPCLQHWPN